VPELAAELESVLGASRCLTDPEETASYTTDWTRRWSGPAVAVARPRGIEDVRAVLEIAGRHGAAVIPQGGNTGLVGGSVPRREARPQVVLSLRGMTAIEPLEPASRLLTAGAGTALAEAQSAAAAVGRQLGIDLTARDSATLGGMLATNAGGMEVVRYGPMRARVAGVEAVLADGTVVAQLSGLVKDNVGWDPVGLLAGSEGTLAIVTKVRMRLEPSPAHRVVALVALRDVAAAVALVNGPLRSLRSLEAVELTLAEGMELVAAQFDLPPPVGIGAGTHPRAWLTVEAAADTDPTDDLATALDDPAVVDAAVASDGATRARLWAYRELHTDAVSRLGVPHKLDVSVQPSLLVDLLHELPGVVDGAAPGARLVVWGHVADGNVHVNVVGPPLDDDGVDDAVCRLVLGLGGSISAEHGIGVARRRWLALSRPAGTLALMARVKAALDPHNILNPGVLVPT
jgi:FAD/FMN-containing dehydrogenase